MLHSDSEVGMYLIFCSLPPSLGSPFSIECVGVLQVLRGCCQFDGWHQKASKMECSQATLMCGVTVWCCGRWLPWHLSPTRWITLYSLQLLMPHGWRNTCLTAAVGSLWMYCQFVRPLCWVQQSKSSHSHYSSILDGKVGKWIYEITVGIPVCASCSSKVFCKSVSLKICLNLQRHESSTISSELLAAEQVDSTLMVLYRLFFVMKWLVAQYS